MNTPLRPVPLVGSLVLVAVLALPLQAQDRGTPNQANWSQLERFSSDNLDRFVHSQSVQSNWIHETDSLWYQWEDSRGTRYHLVDPAGPGKGFLFDHERMAALLSEELESYLEAHELPISEIEFAEEADRFTFEAEDVRFEYHLDDQTLENLGEVEEDEEEEDEREWRSFSPDSTAYVYAEEHNLYFVEIIDEEEQDAVQVTDDGEEDYGFGSREVDEDEEEDIDPTDFRVRPNVNWSEDSRAFSVTRTDRRHVSELYLVDSLEEPRPSLESYRYSMPGEEDVPQVELHTFNRDEVELRELDVDRYRDQRLMHIHWTNGSSDHLRLVRRARSQRALELIEVDMATDGVRVLLTEAVDKGHLRTQSPRYLDEDNTGDFLWYSRRTGWAHYYRYGHDGNLLNPLTSGSWNVLSISEVDEDDDRVWFTAVGREEAQNPYYRHLYRVEADGSGLTLLDRGAADQRSSLSPSNRFILTNSSRVDMAPRAVLRDGNGEVILELEEMDVSELEEFGWRLAETFVVKAADGVTDIYGNMWKPFDFDPERSYPVIAHVYPGPQTESVRTTFGATLSQQELAQLGFIVIQIGNRGGSPLRSAAYHSFGYFDLRDYGLADKKAGIQELGKRHSWIDVDRVGIYGHSGGGFMTAAALMVPPYNEFFSVGASSAGNHDNNVYNQNWSEQHHGLEVKCVPPEATAEDDDEGVANGNGNGDEAETRRRRVRTVPNEDHCEADEELQFEIEVPANHEVAENLKGRLLLVHGDMDSNVHHAGTMRLARELIRNEKRFDFMMFPGMRHGFGEYSSYWQRMMQEYFAEHLLGDYYRSSADMNELP